MRDVAGIVLKTIVVLSVVGLLAQTYDFITQLSYFDVSFHSVPSLFESWFFGASSPFGSVPPAWYPLALMALAMVGLRFRHQD